MKVSDVTLGPPKGVEQLGRSREGASRVPGSAPDAPFHARALRDVLRVAGPAGQRVPAGGYRAGPAGKRSRGAVGPGGPSWGQVTRRRLIHPRISFMHVGPDRRVVTDAEAGSQPR